MSILNRKKKPNKTKPNPFRRPFEFQEPEPKNSDTISRPPLVETPLRQKSVPKKPKTKKVGRPAYKNPKNKKNKRFTVCCTEGEMREIRIFAAERDISVSDLVMRCISQYILEKKGPK
tara:strand:+ start:3180 stop:3533 length:354 start_codon:yes stop_codon:yes gene_type:complete